MHEVRKPNDGDASISIIDFDVDVYIDTILPLSNGNGNGNWITSICTDDCTELVPSKNFLMTTLTVRYKQNLFPTKKYLSIIVVQ